MSDLISISEAARRLEINRSVLNRYINQSGISKSRVGSRMLISFDQVSDLVRTLAASGHFRSGAVQTSSKNKRSDNTDLVDLLKTELNNLRSDRNQIQQEYETVKLDNKDLRRENKQLQEEIKALLKNENKGMVSRWIRTFSEVKKSL